MPSRSFAFAVATVALLAGYSMPVLAEGTAKAVAELKDSTGKALGRAEFAESPSGLLIRLELTGLPPGWHGLRIHDAGKCEGDFASAGDIYNPLGAEHGLLNENGPSAGDLPNVHAASDGTIGAEVISPLLHLSSESEDTLLDEDGAALIVFSNADDHHTQPDGGAGKPLACGPIVAK